MKQIVLFLADGEYLYFKSLFRAGVALRRFEATYKKNGYIKVYHRDKTGKVVKTQKFVLSKPVRLLPSWVYLGWIDDLLGLLTYRKLEELD